ncbi:MAG: toll/interleukin-1 receptor domain-containing protein, partial [Cyanobacteriota bacterium]
MSLRAPTEWLRRQPATAPSSRAQPQRRGLLLCSSRADRKWVERLTRVLAPLLQGTGQELRLWDESTFQPRHSWREEIATALAEAKVALLLVSPNFLASKFVMLQELPKLLAAAEADGGRVLWVSLSPCLVEHTPIGEYQALLPPGQSLDGLVWLRRQQALKTIAQGTHAALLGFSP